ncbi:helix-turn-helix domain-containing protein [Streptomyces murinus]|uniref:helix-turn-helix domain-containing protein n=1 Tax=Streptomyces murinus TaxID=33900 RepID=UPI000A1F89C4|nr:helix-turn-helix domain-containing protein [Streptomyces murinus]WDO05707.1 helix-turn-helix domain-containing protein [Streptomyces murinus]
MKDPEEGGFSFTEMFDLPVAVDLRTAARALGIGSTTAYRLISKDEFPCPILRVGGRYRIPTNELMRALGIDDHPRYSVDPDVGGPGNGF